MKKIGMLLLSILSLATTAFVIKDINIASLQSALVAALFISIINTFFKPILLLLTLPLNIMTLGFFTFLLNGFLFIIVSWLVPGFSIDSYLWAIIGAAIYSLVMTFLSTIFYEQ